MRVAYADPPYLGCAKRLYGGQHPEAAVWDDPQSHIDLVHTLVEEYPDGWALSCNPKDLSALLPVMDDVRVAAWCKSWHQIRPLVSVQYAWEPVILYGGRQSSNRVPMIRDWLVCPATKQTGTIGAKPKKFCFWVFELLGLQPGDELVDMFPGSGAISHAWEAYIMQGRLDMDLVMNPTPYDK